MLGEVHGPLFGEMQPAFQRAFYRPELDRDLICDAGVDPARLIIADGLARDPIALRDVAMPRDRGTEGSPSSLPEMITKDQV